MSASSASPVYFTRLSSSSLDTRQPDDKLAVFKEMIDNATTAELIVYAEYVKTASINRLNWATHCILDVSSTLKSEFRSLAKMELINAGKLATRQMKNCTTVYVNTLIPSTVARRIGSNCTSLQRFSVRPSNNCVNDIAVYYPVRPSNNCANDVVVCYPPLVKGVSKCTTESKILYECDDAGTDLTVHWYTLNATIANANVVDDINKSADGKTFKRVKELFLHVIKPAQGEFLTDDNAQSLLLEAMIQGDSASQYAASKANGNAVGIISSLPTALTIALGMRLKSSLCGNATIIDFKYNANGYVWVSDKECDEDN